MKPVITLLLLSLLLAGCAHRSSAVRETESASPMAGYFDNGAGIAGAPSPQSPRVVGRAKMGALMAAPAELPDASMAEPNSPKAQSETSVNAGDLDPSKPGANRKVIYTANIGLRVANKRNTAEIVRQVFEKHGGFIQNSSLDDLTFRVKPDQFDATVAELETLGEVIARNINSNDITEQYTDVELRLETANSSRQRLLALLDKATATKDVIEIERDLRRLTEEIETMKGRMRYLSDQVDLATITVHLEEKFIDQTPSPRRSSTPHEWMVEMGVEKTLQAIEPDPPLCRRAMIFWGPEFRLRTADNTPAPAGFVPLKMTRKLLIAGTPEDFRLRVRSFEISKKQTGTLAFWVEATKAELANNRGYNITASEAATLETPGLEGWHLASQVVYGGEKWAYDFWLVRSTSTPQEFVTVEYARLAAAAVDPTKVQFEADVKTAVAGMRK